MKPTSDDRTPAVLGDYSIVPYQSTHNTGGAVMGTSPRDSAVNSYLQSWDVPNVFVVGASAFPHNSAYNPTGPVGALAVLDGGCDQEPVPQPSRVDDVMRRLVGGWWFVAVRGRCFIVASSALAPLRRS